MMLGIRRRLVPWIENRRVGLLKFAGVVRDKCKPGCGDDEIRLRERMSCLAPILNQQSPLNHDVCRDPKRAARTSGAPYG